ncbi:MAG: TonB-dependent receptor domain-containing protein [Fidelibacterota bacterium]
MKPVSLLNIFLLVISFIIPFSGMMAEEDIINAKGIITGVILDAETQQPLIGANVIVKDIGVGDATNDEGRFYIKEIPVGTHHLWVSMIGYEKRVLLNLPVTSVRPLDLIVELRISSLKGEEVEVTGKAFTRSSASVVSTLHVDNAEIRSDPGGTFDIQRVVQSLPSVMTATDQENEIITRGGMPGENLFLLDNIEIPNPNHFGFEGVGGGPINMINPLFVRDIEFTPGAFSARFGDKASSIMDIKLREGSRKHYESDFDLSMAGAGFNVEGPLAAGRGSFLASSLWSYLELIVKSFGMVAIPRYNNHQAKIVYDLSPNNRLIAIGLAGFDQINIESENEVVSRGAESVDWKGETYVGGITLQTLLGNRGYGLTTLSAVDKNSYTWVYNFGTKDNPTFTRDNSLTENTLKSDWFLKTSLGNFSVGLQMRQVNFYYKEWAKADTVYLYDTTFWDGEEWSIDDPPTVGITYVGPEFNFNEKGSVWKMGIYSQWQKTLSRKSQVTAGGRFDYFTATEELVFSPRLNWEFYLSDVTTFHLGYGKHYQFPGYYLVFRDPKGFNKDLKAKYTHQFVVGMERFFDLDFRGSLEGFYKTYDNLPTHYYWTNPKEEYPSSLEHSTHWLSEGEAKSYGFEFFLQKKLTHNWHLLFSYAWSHSQAKDMRLFFSESGSPNDQEQDGEWYDWDYDIRHQFTFIGGWKKKFHEETWYQELKKKKWFRITTMILGPLNPLADEIELNVRFGYNSGRPYTERTYLPELRDWVATEYADWNNLRFPEYHRLDLMFLQRWMLPKMNIVAYIDIMNIYDRNNLWDYAYNSDGTKSKVWQYKTMPVGGFTLEF